MLYLNSPTEKMKNRKYLPTAIAIILMALLIGSWIVVVKTKAPGPVKLTILCPDGHVADGASVVVVPRPESRRVFIFEGDVNPPPFRDAQQFQSGPDGVVSIPSSTPRQGMVVLHTTGYAELSPDAWARGGNINLLEWARIEGRLMIGSRPGAGQTVRAQVSFKRLSAQDWPRLFFVNARTDADGRFVLQRIPPVGAAELSRVVNTNQLSQAKAVDVAPGKTTKVELGGMGRQVVGRLDAPAALMDRHDWLWVGEICTSEKVPPDPMPDDVKKQTAEQRQRWRTEFGKSDAGKAYLAARQKVLDSPTYPLEVASDGSFRIEDVAAGTYDLRVRILLKEGVDPGDHTYGEIARGEGQVVVPPMPKGRSDEPLQTPPVVLRSIDVAVLGKSAPDFTVPNLTGGTLKLADFRGRYVLLDFWATWCPGCLEEMPNLKTVYKEFAPSGRLAIIGLSLDATASDALSYVRKNQIEWDQAWIGGDAGKSVLESYPSDGIPAIWLIGPDGKVIARDLSGDQIRSTIAAKL
jgi:thiol-disulfide isomerase/thioredoxin